jgi:hypothetical protein
VKFHPWFDHRALWFAVTDAQRLAGRARSSEDTR